MASKAYSTVIRVNEELREGNYWMVTSDDLPGMILGGRDILKLREDVPNVIKSLFELNCGMKVDVYPAVKLKEMTSKKPTRQNVVSRLSDWTAIPHLA